MMGYLFWHLLSNSFDRLRREFDSLWLEPGEDSHKCFVRLVEFAKIKFQWIVRREKTFKFSLMCPQHWTLSKRSAIKFWIYLQQWNTVLEFIKLHVKIYEQSFAGIQFVIFVFNVILYVVSGCDIIEVVRLESDWKRKFMLGSNTLSQKIVKLQLYYFKTYPKHWHPSIKNYFNRNAMKNHICCKLYGSIPSIRWVTTCIVREYFGTRRYLFLW